MNLFTGHIPPTEDDADKPCFELEKKIKYGSA